jgi:hypothetical protein
MESKGLSLGYLCAVIAGGLQAKRIHSSHTEPDREVDDWLTRHKYLETAGKWLGIDDRSDKQSVNVQVNVIPILGKEVQAE